MKTYLAQKKRKDYIYTLTMVISSLFFPLRTKHRLRDI